MNILIDNLENIQESEKLTKVLKEVISILVSAINDWPNPILSLVDYEKEIDKLVGGDVDKKKIEKCISNIDYSQYAWEAESLSQLIDIFNYYEEGKLLKEIVNDIRIKIEG